jgi:DNA-3-methyladenine glycosylase I
VKSSRAARGLIEEGGSLAAHFWPRAASDALAPRATADIPAETAASRALSRDLKRRGFSFVGPTIVYAFMQAVGLVDDDAHGCVVRRPTEEQRRPVLQRFGVTARPG